MKTVFLTRMVQVVLQDDNQRDILFYQIFINGRKGNIFGLSGFGVKYLTLEHFKELGKFCNIDQIEAIFEPDVLKYLAKILPIEVNIEVTDLEKMVDGKIVVKALFSLT